MYSLPKWAMLSTGQSRAGACPGYFAKAGSVLREGELDDDDDDYDLYDADGDEDDGDDDDDERECDPVDRLGRFCQGWLCPQGRWTGRSSKKVSRLGLATSQLCAAKKFGKNYWDFGASRSLSLIHMEIFYKDTSVDT